jgi:hypothetical protein
MYYSSSESSERALHVNHPHALMKVGIDDVGTSMGSYGSALHLGGFDNGRVLHCKRPALVSRSVSDCAVSPFGF